MMKCLTLAAALAATPSLALAASYVALSIDKTELVITDLTTPRLTDGKAETFVITVHRAPKKSKRGSAEYAINKIDIDCKTDKSRVFYFASYDMNSRLIVAEPDPKAWRKIAAGSNEEGLRTLGCKGELPKAVFRIGDQRVGQIMASYRAGAYDRYIH